MKRILFVDDEPRILEGLQRLLRPQRQQWDMVFACGGPAALDQLQSGSFDVIVTDMRMPRIDGAELLRHVAENYPQMVRIILSGHSELEAVLRVVAVAHQFLTKPCQPEVLKGAVERACALQNLLASPGLRGLVGRLGALPSRPSEYESLLRLLDDPNASIHDLARIVQRDVAMYARCLQLVNSAFFGLSQRVTTIEQAISYLGLRMLKSLVFSTSAFSVFKVDQRLESLCYHDLSTHALNTAKIATRLVPDRGLADDAFMCGMLHDVGVLVFATRIPDAYLEILDRAKHEGRSVFAVERDALGCGHAEVGAYLLGAWGLPYAVVEAVARHHTPGETTSRGIDLVGATHVADALAHELDDPDPDPRTESWLDFNYVEQIGGAASLATWRTMAASVVKSEEIA